MNEQAHGAAEPCRLLHSKGAAFLLNIDASTGKMVDLCRILLPQGASTGPSTLSMNTAQRNLLLSAERRACLAINMPVATDCAATALQESTLRLLQLWAVFRVRCEWFHLSLPQSLVIAHVFAN